MFEPAYDQMIWMIDNVIKLPLESKMRSCSGHQLMEHITVTWYECKEDARKTHSQALSKASMRPFRNNKPNNTTVVKTEKEEKRNPASAVSQNTTQKHDASRNNVIDSMPLECTYDNSTTSSQDLSKTCVRQLNNDVAKNNACKINNEQVLKGDVSISKNIEENDKVRVLIVCISHFTAR